MRPVEEVAIHEACHAVTALSFGTRVRSISIDWVGGGGLTTLAKVPPAFPGMFIRLAAQVGEELAFGEFDVLGARNDQANAELCAFELTRDLDAADRLLARTRDELRPFLLYRWYQVELLAKRLLESWGGLDAADIDRIPPPMPFARATVQHAREQLP